MPFYRPLAPHARHGYPFDEPVPPADRERIAKAILRLRSQLAAELPQRSLDESLLLATWNIREFDAGDKSDPRLTESYYYIAEILDHFDLIAVQEVREDLAPLERVMKLLGPWWKYIVTDVTYGRSGNGERMAFVYDSRKVAFGGLAGEIVLPAESLKGGGLQFARTPFLCGFKAHWAKFNLCTVHIYYGKTSPTDERRVREIGDLAKLLARYVAGPPPKQPGRPRTAENLILLGDFNIFSPEDETMRRLLDAGFTVPPELMKRPGSNLDRSKFYDQIAFRTRPDRFATTGRAGVFDFFQSVFRDEDEADAVKRMSPQRAAEYRQARRPSTYYRNWKTYQMSDHLVLWVELKIDYSHAYLQEAARQKDVPPGAAPEASPDAPALPRTKARGRRGSTRRK